MHQLSTWNFRPQRSYCKFSNTLDLSLRKTSHGSRAVKFHRYGDTCGDDNSHLSPFATFMEAKQISAGRPGPLVPDSRGGQISELRSSSVPLSRSLAAQDRYSTRDLRQTIRLRPFCPCATIAARPSTGSRDTLHSSSFPVRQSERIGPKMRLSRYAPLTRRPMIMKIGLVNFEGACAPIAESWTKIGE